MGRETFRESRPSRERQPDSDLLDRDRLVTPGELAEYLQVPRHTLDTWAPGGGPPFHKVGIHRRYTPADVRAWLAGLRREV